MPSSPKKTIINTRENKKLCWKEKVAMDYEPQL